MVPKRHPPDRLEDQRHTAVYLFGAVCAERDAAYGLVLPIVSTSAMQTFLDQLSGQVTPGAHMLLIIDRAGWHRAGDLVMADNHGRLPAALFTRVERDRATLALSQGTLPLAPPLSRLRRHRRCRLQGLAAGHQ
jgi:hypothetical protein